MNDQDMLERRITYLEEQQNDPIDRGLTVKDDNRIRMLEQKIYELTEILANKASPSSIDTTSKGKEKTPIPIPKDDDEE